MVRESFSFSFPGAGLFEQIDNILAAIELGDFQRSTSLVVFHREICAGIQKVANN